LAENAIQKNCRTQICAWHFFSSYYSAREKRLHANRILCGVPRVANSPYPGFYSDSKKGAACTAVVLGARARKLQTFTLVHHNIKKFFDRKSEILCNFIVESFMHFRCVLWILHRFFEKGLKCMMRIEMHVKGHSFARRLINENCFFVFFGQERQVSLIR
jgi:hypothetical protein